MVTQYLSPEATEKAVTEVKNLYTHLIGGGFADLSRLPTETLSDEVPKGTVKRYTPTADPDPNALPTLLVPPLATAATAFDLHRGCSMAEFLLDQGRPLYVVDFGDVSSLRDKDLGLEYWIDEVIPNAVRVVSEDSGGREVHLLGWCLGGYLSYFAHVADPSLPIASVSTVATPFDTTVVDAVKPVRLMEELTKGVPTTTLLRIAGGSPAAMNSLLFKWSTPDRQLKKPLFLVKKRADPETLAQIQAVDALMDTMEAYPGRSFAQIYHTFIRSNHLREGTIQLGDDRTLSLENVTVPVMAIAGSADSLFAPPASVAHVASLLTNAPHVRIETAPGGHLGVLAGTKARGTTWRYLDEFMREVDEGPEDDEDAELEGEETLDDAVVEQADPSDET